MSANGWDGRRVLVTGHTGFKGSWLALWLHRLGAQVTGLALDPPTEPSNFGLSHVGDVLARDLRGDVRNPAVVRAAIDAANPEVVFHLAAQPLVRVAHAAPAETFEVNVMGTVQVLDALRLSGRPCAVVVVTSDKCYAGDTGPGGYTEDDRLGASEAYGTSKAAAELVTEAYRRTYFPPEDISSHGVAVATVRAGNVIGGGDWAQDRILPDFIRAATGGYPLVVRNPSHRRPWQHVLVPLSGYLRVADRLLGSDAALVARGWNFGPGAQDALNVGELIERCTRGWPGSGWVAKADPGAPPEVGELRLDSSLATGALGWAPAWCVDRAVSSTIDWYRQWAEGADLRDASMADIAAYERDTDRAQASLEGAPA